MIRRPPRSTLFPYTTLFRSGEVTPQQRAVAGFRRVDGVAREVGPLDGPLGDVPRLDVVAAELDRDVPPGLTSAFKIGRAHSELQSRQYLVCRLLLEKKKKLI